MTSVLYEKYLWKRQRYQRHVDIDPHPPAWLRPGLCSLGSVGVSRCRGAAEMIMRLLAADVGHNLLSLPITPSCGHQSLLIHLFLPQQPVYCCKKIHAHPELWTEPDECVGRENLHPFSRVAGGSCAWIEPLPFTFERQRPFKVYVGLRRGN